MCKFETILKTSGCMTRMPLVCQACSLYAIEKNLVITTQSPIHK